MGEQRAVTLDLWLTLITEMPPVPGDRDISRNELRLENAVAALTDAGHSVTADDLDAAFKRVRQDMDHAHWNGVDRTFDLWVRQVVEYAAPGVFDKLPDDDANAVLGAVDDPFLQYPPIIHSSATEVVRELGERGLKVALISNTGFTSGTAYRKWFIDLGWEGLFDVIAFSNEVNMAKPTGAIFTDTLEELGVPPADALHVGDSLHSDVAGAHAQGMSTVWISGYDKSEPAIQPDFTIADLSELPATVKEWLNRG
jgi:putative hydrolase of the HAD superfamily